MSLRSCRVIDNAASFGLRDSAGLIKSPTAEILMLLLEHDRQVTLLDGDVVYTNFSKGLGNSKDDPEINIRHIGFVRCLMQIDGSPR